MIEKAVFYKVLCVRIGPFYSEIINEQNFGTQQEALEFADGLDPAQITALVVRMHKDCVAIAS